jgi:hypothetical protein
MPNSFPEALREVCSEMKKLPSLNAAQRWIERQLGVMHNIVANAAAGVPANVLGVLQGAVDFQPEGSPRSDTEQPVSQSPRVALIWKLLEYAVQPGSVPPSNLVSSLIANSIPCASLPARADNAPHLSILADAARTSLNHTASRVSASQVDCEDSEYSAIEYFMQQVSLQVHAMYRNIDGARSTLCILAQRPHDESGRVHTWCVRTVASYTQYLRYEHFPRLECLKRDRSNTTRIFRYWSGAVAMLSKDWCRALLLFRASALCTVEHLHISMRGKALLGMCEALLASAVSFHLPELSVDGFMEAVQRSGKDAVEACLEMFSALGKILKGEAGLASGDPCVAVVGPILPALKELAAHAHRCAVMAEDAGVGLRAMLVVRAVLMMDGSVRCASNGELVWDVESERACWRTELVEGGSCGRVNGLLRRLRRNVFVTRRLLGCHAVLDPDAVWRMNCALARCSE